MFFKHFFTLNTELLVQNFSFLYEPKFKRDCLAVLFINIDKLTMTNLTVVTCTDRTSHDHPCLGSMLCSCPDQLCPQPPAPPVLLHHHSKDVEQGGGRELPHQCPVVQGLHYLA